MKELVAGQKAKAKSGYHCFELGQEIEFIEIADNAEHGYKGDTIVYVFKGFVELFGEEVDQHLTENEFALIS